MNISAVLFVKVLSQPGNNSRPRPRQRVVTGKGFGDCGCFHYCRFVQLDWLKEYKQYTAPFYMKLKALLTHQDPDQMTDSRLCCAELIFRVVRTNQKIADRVND